MPNVYTKKESATSKFKNHKTPHNTKKSVSETQKNCNTHPYTHWTINISNIKEG